MLSEDLRTMTPERFLEAYEPDIYRRVTGLMPGHSVTSATGVLIDDLGLSNGNGHTVVVNDVVRLGGST